MAISIKTAGTSLQGYTDTGYTPERISDLLTAAGAKVELLTSDHFFDGKVFMEFAVEIFGVVVTIYTYKASTEELTAMWDGGYEWHVGGRSEEAVHVLNFIGIDSRVA